MVAATLNGGANGQFKADTSTVTWVVATPVLSSSPVTGQFFAADGSGVFNTPATAAAFMQVFPNIDFNPVVNQARPFTDVVNDRTENAIGSPVAQGGGYQAGVGPLYSFSGVFNDVLNVPAAGAVTFSLTSDDGFVLGVGNGATRVSGPQVNTAAVTPFLNYPVMGGVNGRGTSTNSVVVNFRAAGAYPYELDYAKGGDSHLTLENLPVTVTVTGENAQTRSVTTEGTGQSVFAYAGPRSATGVDTVQALAHVNGSDTYSNAVVVVWSDRQFEHGRGGGCGHCQTWR